MRWSKLWGAVLVTSLAAGCELFTTFDYSKISEGGGGTGGGGAGGAPTTTTTTGGGTGGSMCDPANCPAPSDECKVAACDDMGACIEENVPDGQDATTQSAGDCKKNVCMGGSVMSANDDTDPLDDMNDCTVDSCNAGTPQSDPATAGAMCSSGGGKVCDGMSTCVECLENADCTDVAEPECQMNQCVPATCDDTILNGNETDVDCGGACKKCDTSQDCGGDADCYHGKCDAGKCAAPACDDGIQNGGTYLMDDGETDVDCGGPCQDKCGPSKGCDVDGDCDGNQCTGMNGTCIPNCSDGVMNNAETDQDCGGGTCSGCAVGNNCGMSDTNCVATAYCDGGGVCAAKKMPGVTCAAMNECLMGVCDATDSVCCNMMCSGTCQSCKLAGSAGTCTPVAQGQDPDSECAGTDVCDGGMGCVKVNGETCAMGAQCLSGNCVDGVCCNLGCGGTCQACDLAGSVGTCTNVPSNADPANECAAGDCNGGGACEKTNGDGCGNAAECASGFCADGVCCDTACNGTCVACNVAGNGGTCTNVPVGTDPVGECGGNTPDCSGQGTCGLPTAAACTNNNQCGTGFCVDGVCCNTACDAACKACDVMGSEGTCSNAAEGMQDTCMVGQTCLAGACQ